MRKIVIVGFICSLLVGNLLAQKQYKYEIEPNDPIKARIYTLDNGLKVYMSVNKLEPKIKITIATKAGSKLDPEETTGLAHYFEHLMFKGSESFGTTNYAQEKPLLDQIEGLFELYRKSKDEKERTRIYAQIDSLSQVASTYAIPNEYDKLMSIIGSSGTNAGTWIDFTNYYENIPSNQLENFLIIQSDRFQHPVIRLFHTELETIYEEKNMNLTQDSRRVSTALMEGLFAHHPYGTQTTIGTQEHLRNPSITNVKNFFDTYYVPNNMAIIMAGDFDPDEAIALIDTYFSAMQPAPLPEFTFTPETPITTPIVKEVIGKDAENLLLAWRMNNPLSAEFPVMILAEMILTNGHAGLVDLNINQKQRMLNAGSAPGPLHDYCYLAMYGSPKKGQTLEEVRDILLEQIDLLQKGEFPDWLLQACINDLRLRDIKNFESNAGRSSEMEDAFCLDIPWKDKVNLLDELEKITKQQIMDFAKKYLGKDNYVIVYKRQGKPTDIEKVKKPKITPIKINRESKSDFVKMIEERKVPEIQPVFMDAAKEIKSVEAQNGVKVYYTKNEENELFSLNYVIDIGSYQDRYLDIASDYIEYLGTDKYTPEQIKEEFYKLGCTFSMSSGADRSYVTLSGLSQNMEAAMELVEHILKNAKPNQEALNNLIGDISKYRENAKSNQRAAMTYLVNYGMYGANSPIRYTQLSTNELKAITPEQLIAKLQEWITYKQFVIYYGQETPEKVVLAINKIHNPKDLKDIPELRIFKEDVPTKNRVYVVHFETPQLSCYSYSFGNPYQKELVPTIRLYNEYFGGSMNSIVFQELREARALAYTAGGQYTIPNRLEQLHYNVSYIMCGTDKLKQSIEAFNELSANMPENEASFTIAKEAVINSYRTNRIAPENKVWTYLSWLRLKQTEDPRKANFEALPAINFQNIKQFQKEYVYGKPQTYVILGNTKEMDMKFVKTIGKVKVLKLEELFGF
ncbi:MAG: insulinase family protein [Tannerella sp.]|jgi:predicted Zn-dependent peptidase|nr:insulinase family protein [Tannerella sp.]